MYVCVCLCLGPCITLPLHTFPNGDLNKNKINSRNGGKKHISVNKGMVHEDMVKLNRKLKLK